MKKIHKNSQPLNRYIEKSLYDQKSGYYMSKNPFGKSGDFITSPNISVLFSEILTLWIILYWKKLGKPSKLNIIELGAGNGEMMLQIIKTSKNFMHFNKASNFFILERSKKLKEIQKKKLKDYKVKWIKNLNLLNKNKSLFLSNEFLDAFPIKQFEKKKKIWYEKYVENFKNKKFIKNKKIKIKEFERLAGFNFSKNQNFVEISFELIKFLKLISKHLNKNKGGAIFIDYGFVKQKMFNTLQSIKNHKYANFLNSKNDMDITYLVNFDMISKIFKNNNLIINGLTTQGSFLKEMGILNRAENVGKKMSFIKKADLFYRINRLINDKQMGGLFKVLFVSDKHSKFNVGFTRNEIK